MIDAHGKYNLSVLGHRYMSLWDARIMLHVCDDFVSQLLLIESSFTCAKAKCSEDVLGGDVDASTEMEQSTFPFPTLMECILD